LAEVWLSRRWGCGRRIPLFAEDLQAIGHVLNSQSKSAGRPPAGLFEELLRSLQRPGVASTG
jgi:hypothetical protein